MKKTVNPFKFGTVVHGRQFTGRKTERRELTTDIFNNINVILYGPRRYGKTSLVLQTFTDISRTNPKFIGLHIDFFKIHSREKFLQLISAEIGRKSGWSMEKTIDLFRTILRGIQPQSSIDNDGKPILQLGFQQTPSSQDFEAVLDLLPAMAQKGYQVAVLLDEFQDIVRLNGNNFQRELRAVIQKHDDVSYIFCGSKEQMINDIFNSANSPLYNIGRHRYVDKIPDTDFKKYLVNKMRKIQPGFTTGLAQKIYDTSDGIPNYVQMLAYEYYNLAIGRPDEIDSTLIDLATEQLIADRREQFSMLYEMLTPSQKKILEIVLATDGIKVFRQEITNKFRIAIGTLQKGLKGLQENGVLRIEQKHYQFQDIFFKRWLTEYL